MDLKSYFPEGISVVHHDESNSGSDSTDFAPTVLPQPPLRFDKMRHKMMMMRRPRDAPLLPPIREGSLSPETAANDSIHQVHCFLCYRKIMRSFGEATYFKPCECDRLYVHTACALEEEHFLGIRCSRCYKTFRPQERKKEKPTCLKMSPPERRIGGSDGVVLMENQINTNIVCMCCKNQKYVKPTNAQRYDARFILPCFCGVAAHHGCMVSLVKEQKSCQNCGVKYRHFVYGSVLDFFKRYWCQYACFISCFLIFLGFFCLSFFNSMVFTKRHGFRDIALFMLSSFFLLILGVLVCFMVKYTVRNRFPRFKARYGHVTVVSYNPDAQTRKAAKKSLKSSRSSPTGEFDDVQLNEVFVKQNRKADSEEKQPLTVQSPPQPQPQPQKVPVVPPIVVVDNCNNTLEHGRQEVVDLTLGQQLFGVCSNYQSSSTPIENSEVFVFEEKKTESNA